MIRQREGTFLGEDGLETRKSREVAGGNEWGEMGQNGEGGGPGKGLTEQEGSEGCEEFGLKGVSKVMAWMDGEYGPKVHVPEAWSLV